MAEVPEGRNVYRSELETMRVSPLPLGEGTGVRAYGGTQPDPHPTLSQGERAEEAFLRFALISNSTRFRLRFGCRNCLRMTLRDRPFAERHVTFGANEVRILPAALDLKIQRPSFVEGAGNMTTVGAAT